MILMRILITELSGNLVPDDFQGDSAPLLDRYVDLLRKRLAAEYPECDIEIDLQNAEGAMPNQVIVQGVESWADEEEIRERIDRIRDDVWDTIFG
jgi:hypothetical protein